MQQENSRDKNRKSEAQKRFDEAENAGRFAGDDADARNARAQAEQNVKQDAQNSGNRQRQKMGDGQIMDADAVRPGHANMMEEEAQNINKDTTGADRLDDDSESQKARNKAGQGIQQGRDTGSSDDRSRNSSSR